MMATENARTAWRWTWFDALWRDLRYAARSMRNGPTFTIAAVLTLALGIGVNAAIFTAVNEVFLTPLPVRNHKDLRLLSWASREPAFAARGLPMFDVNTQDQGNTIKNFSYPVYRTLRDRASAFSEVACTRWEGANLPGIGNVSRQLVSSNYLLTLGVKASFGRTILPDDDRPGAAPVAVISYGFWERIFGRDPRILNRTIKLDQTDFTIVGVMPPEFFGVDPMSRFDVMTAMRPSLASLPNALSDSRDWGRCAAVIARLRPGVSEERARAESEALVRQSILADPPNEPYELPRMWIANLDRGVDTLRRATYLPLTVLLSTAGLILLIACANIAGLLLARATARQKEIATRLALGAPRMRIVRQLLTESLLLSGIGGAAGLALAYLASPLLPRLFQQFNYYRFNSLGVQLRPDLRVVGFSIALAVLTGLLFGLAPALRATRVDLIAAMKASASSAGRLRFTCGKATLVVQVALSMTLLIGAGLFIRTLLNLRSVPMDYDPKGLLYFVADISGRNAAFVDSVVQRLANIPGVTSATASMWPLFTSAPDTYLQVCVPGDAPKNFDDRFADSDVILPRFFETWGVPLLRGRDFELSDGPRSVIVNDAFVKRYLAGAGDPVGQAVRLGPQCVPETIIGVAGNSTDRPRIKPRPFVYRRYAKPPPQITFAVRSAGDLATVAPVMRRVMSDLGTRIYDPVTTGIEYRDQTMSQERMFTGLLMAFSSLALFISCLGIYGMLAYIVTRRTSEIGIRIALGVQTRDAIWMVIRESLVPVAAGLLAGFGGAFALARFVHSLLFGVSTSDPWTIAGAAIVFLSTAAIAAFLPARRASRVNPTQVLRYE